MSAPKPEGLILALPSKGRLQEDAVAYLARAGLAVRREGGERTYIGALAGMPDAQVRFLSASEIAQSLETGAIHLGITGEDLMREHAPDFEKSIHAVKSLGFGHARVVVAVPQAWIDVRDMADLEEVCHDFRQRHRRRLRVATKYLSLTRGFFTAHGLGDYAIVESPGATEAAPAADTAEIIVDITSTGSTLAANNLKVLPDGEILSSQAVLGASLNAIWDDKSLGVFARIADMIGAREAARGMHEIACDPPLTDKKLLARLEAQGCIAQKGGQGAASVLCPEKSLYEVVGLMRQHGAARLSVGRPDYLFGQGNPLYDAFVERLK